MGGVGVGEGGKAGTSPRPSARGSGVSRPCCPASGDTEGNDRHM